MHVCLGATCERTVIEVSSIGIFMVMNVCCSILATIVHDCFRAVRSVHICTVVVFKHVSDSCRAIFSLGLVMFSNMFSLKCLKCLYDLYIRNKKLWPETSVSLTGSCCVNFTRPLVEHMLEVSEVSIYSFGFLVIVPEFF